MNESCGTGQPVLPARAAELGESRRLSVRGGAGPGRTLEAAGTPQFRKNPLQEARLLPEPGKLPGLRRRNWVSPRRLSVPLDSAEHSAWSLLNHTGDL